MLKTAGTKWLQKIQNDQNTAATRKIQNSYTKVETEQKTITKIIDKGSGPPEPSWSLFEITVISQSNNYRKTQND